MIDIETRLAELENVFVGDGVHLSGFDKALAVHVANHLSGRDVDLWWCEPEADNAVGAAFRNGDKGLIQIKPEMKQERAFSTLVHECAHIRMHWSSLPYLGMWRATRNASWRAVRDAEKQKAFDQREREAYAQERYWGWWAANRGDTVTEKMIALLSWQGG